MTTTVGLEFANLFHNFMDQLNDSHVVNNLHKICNYVKKILKFAHTRRK